MEFMMGIELETWLVDWLDLTGIWGSLWPPVRVFGSNPSASQLVWLKVIHYPLANDYITMDRSTMFHGKTH